MCIYSELTEPNYETYLNWFLSGRVYSLCYEQYASVCVSTHILFHVCHNNSYAVRLITITGSFFLLI